MKLGNPCLGVVSEDSARGLRCWPLPARGLAPAAAGKCQRQRRGVGTEAAHPHWALPTGDERGMRMEEEKCCCTVSGLCNSLIMFVVVFCFFLMCSSRVLGREVVC